MLIRMFRGRAATLGRRLAPLLVVGLVALGSCVNSEPSAELELSYADFTGRAPSTDLVVHWDDGTGPHELRGTASSRPHSALVFPRVRTRTAGTLALRTALVSTAGDTLARGTVYLTLRPEWRWGVDIIAAPSGEEVGCNGCVGATRFAFRTLGASDTMFVVWGGSSLSSSPVY